MSQSNDESLPARASVVNAGRLIALDVVVENRRIAGQVLNALALACALVAGTALLVMAVGWLASTGPDGYGDHDWPGVGWLVCLPAGIAAISLTAASTRVSRPTS